MRSSGRHSNETTKSKERKDGDAATGEKERGKKRGDQGEERKRKTLRERERKKRCTYGRVKKGGENASRCRRMACYDRERVLFLDYESYQGSYQESLGSAGRSPQARSLPTLSANGYL